MSLTNLEREKLVTTLQRTFPLQEKWWSIKRNDRLFNKKFWKCAATGAGVCTFAAITYGLIALHQAFNHADGWVLFGSVISLAVGVISSMATAAGVWFSTCEWYYYCKRKMWAKNIEKYKPCIRDYAAQSVSLKKVANALPKVTDKELLLLSKHPQLNPVFTPCFNKELERREKISVVQQINSEFLSPSVEVEHHSHNCTPSDASIKTLIV